MRTLILCVVILSGCIPTAEQRELAKQRAKSAVNKPKEWTDDDFVYRAKGSAKDTILSVLKAPKTATFDEFNVKHIDRKIVTVEGKVTSQNSFGAMLTVPFRCVYWFDGKTLQLSIAELDGKTTHRGENEERLISEYMQARN